MTQSNDVEQLLTPYKAQLQQRAVDSWEGEERSEAELLVDALYVRDALAIHTERFEESGRWIAEQGGELEMPIQALQHTVEALIDELKQLLSEEHPHLLSDAIERLYQGQTSVLLALTRGYQRGNDQIVGENSALVQRLEHRWQALQRINGISNSSLDLDQTLEVTAQVVTDELKVELCSIFFYDDLQRVLTLRATNGPRPLGGMHFTLQLGEGYSGWVADKGRPVLSQDVQTDANFASESNAFGEYHGLMALPIIFFGNAERLIGVISIQSSEPREFTRDEISFVEVVAGIIAINIENGRLYEQTDEQLRRKVYELATIHRLSSNIASTLNLDEVLQFITTQAVHLSGAERSCIFELDPDRRRLQVLAHYGFNSELMRKTHIGVGQCCAGRAVQTGRPSMAVDCFHSDEHCFLHNDPLISSEIHSVLCVPLKAKQKVLGCLCIYSSHRHLLSPEQMQLVNTFANDAAIAIDNARLYEETRRGLELKSVLLQELNHRVKNNLATVAGILSLQRRRTRSSEVRHILAESVNRVQGLAATHDLLAHQDNEARLDDIARRIVSVANTNMSLPDKHITFDVNAESIVIPSRAVSVLALIINEMVSNAIKHGMSGQTEGKVVLRGREEDGTVIVQVIDTGKEPLNEVPLDETGESSAEGLGLSLIKHMISDLGGRFSLRRESSREPIFKQSGTEGGEDCTTEYTVSEIRFPLVRRRRA